MNQPLSTATDYPFHLEGPLCPLLRPPELLASFYAVEELRHAIKSFCKKTTWAGKPATTFAINPAKLQELMASLLNSAEGRAVLQRQSATERVTYLDNAIWHWLSITNPALAQRLGGVCTEVKDRLFLQPAAMQKLLAEIRQESPAELYLTQLAYAVLAFAMLQPENRQEFGELFLAAFPQFASGFGVPAGSL